MIIIDGWPWLHHFAHISFAVHLCPSTRSLGTFLVVNFLLFSFYWKTFLNDVDEEAAAFYLTYEWILVQVNKRNFVVSKEVNHFHWLSFLSLDFHHCLSSSISLRSFTHMLKLKIKQWKSLPFGCHPFRYFPHVSY